MSTMKFVIRGKVQGVFYRASAQVQAQDLNLAGSAKNRPDGSVEVLVCGNALAIEAMERWLRHGPPAARVQTIEREELAEQEISGFLTT